MDLIKKKISIEGARTRTQGLMPYYSVGARYMAPSGSSCYTVAEAEITEASGHNGNWGQFVANPCFLASCGKTYQSMLKNYYDILNMVRKGVKLRKVTTKEGEIIFTEDTGAFFYKGECFSGGTEPDFLYDYAAYDANWFYSNENKSIREETKTIYRLFPGKEVEDEFIVLINDYGGLNKLASYLDGTDYSQIGTTVKIENDDEQTEYRKWSRYCEVIDVCIGRLNVPARIFNEHLKTPKSMAYADIEGYIDWLENEKNLSGNCCSSKLWEARGGEEMLEFLKEKKDEYRDTLDRLNSINYSIPYIEMPLLLTQKFTDIGVLSNIDGEKYEPGSETRAHRVSGHSEEVLMEIPVSGYCATTIDLIAMGQSRKTYPISGSTSIHVESLLRTLRSKKKFMDDQDNVLPGLFRAFEDTPTGKMFCCVKFEDGWHMEETTLRETDLINGDGLAGETLHYSGSTGNTSGKYYRTITTSAAGVRIAETEEVENGETQPLMEHYYFKVKYDNSPDSPMEIPYAKGNATNVYYDEETELYRGDFIHEYPFLDGEKMCFSYVIGGYFYGGNNGNFVAYAGSGDVYYEEHKFIPQHVDYVALDGVDNVPVWSNYIDFDDSLVEINSSTYNLTRQGNIANIIEMTTGEMWNSGWSYDAYLTKEEYLTNFSSPPKVDVNVVIDRGGASAFEMHYKLSECNTMQDLENYANNQLFES